jgi:hypothetical protein
MGQLDSTAVQAPTVAVGRAAMIFSKRSAMGCEQSGHFQFPLGTASKGGFRQWMW